MSYFVFICTLQPILSLGPFGLAQMNLRQITQRLERANSTITYDSGANAA